MAKPQILEEVGKVSELKTNDKTVVGGINEVLEKEKSNAEQINVLKERGYIDTKLLPDGTDFNTIIENGVYKIYEGLNSPLGIGGGFYINRC